MDCKCILNLKMVSEFDMLPTRSDHNSQTESRRSAIEFFFVVFIAALLVLSLFCICFILLIHFKSRNSSHLQNFNSLWTVRFLFVVFIACWGLTAVIRLPLFQRVCLHPLFPKLTPPQQANFCKLHLVLSLGIFEPGFLVILLFLLDVSVHKTTPNGFFSVFYVFASCLPLFLVQVYFVFLDGSNVHFPKFFNRSWLPFHKDTGEVLCAYPFLSTLLFGVFAVIFIFSFLLSFWKVASHVINKALKLRIFALAFTILVCLPLQIMLMGCRLFGRRKIHRTMCLIYLCFSPPSPARWSPPPAEDWVGATVTV
ncbi:Detected protein of unknown function [Hibiscus syriacus]|uniref:Uncharacterized protein n=1 Tax=Hibiscus syriacus TaxID=106335 RepID=A0A6A2XID4_HIBSY|nr:Detected protein of unknown function [Hibiscus syriacus]